MSAKSVLQRFRGQRVYFHGKFEWGVKESLQTVAGAQEATFVDKLDDQTNYLVLQDVASGKTIRLIDAVPAVC